MRRKTKLNRPTKRKRATNRASDAAPVVKINAADVVHVTAVDVGVALSDEQRSLLKRVLEKVLRVLYAFEGGIEVGPDGTIRVIGHLRSQRRATRARQAKPKKGQGVVIVVLPHDTIGRILDRATATPNAASKGRSRRAPSPLPSEAGPALSESVIGALNEAKKDKANLVGPLEASDFNEMSAWCRSVGLTKDGEVVEAAVRASGVRSGHIGNNLVQGHG